MESETLGMVHITDIMP
ncbi:hypothetical protein AB1N83_004240 [Pleurotus pulmonarius]